MDEPISPRSIVVGYDGSEHALCAVRWAAEQSRLEHRPLVAVSVSDVRRYASSRGATPDTGPSRQTHDRLRARAELAVDVVRHTEPGVAVRGLALRGDPRDELLRASHGVHLLVVGSRGRRGGVSRLLGSVSSNLAKHAACPVVVCRPPGDRSQTAGVVVGADATRESRPVIDFAFRQAALRHQSLTVVHAYWDAVVAVETPHRRAGTPAMSDSLPQGPEDLQAQLSMSVAGVREMYPDVRVDLRLGHGLVEEVVLDDHRGWELIVVGRHPWRSVDRWLTGSVAISVLGQARATVAVVPEPDVKAS